MSKNILIYTRSRVIRDGMCRIEQRNKFSVGETVEIMKPNGENPEAVVKRIVNEEGEEQESAPHPKQVLFVELSSCPENMIFCGVVSRVHEAERKSRK